ncbi:PTB domain-containing engulfment adapter protein 1 isoform 4-T10 [Anomaloglossus baeobatrachus]|uniref:PTB domain-containing engulfment adapter protein 1 isoform X4 n=1 Tax=Anomaloglossus baeobatrachus TaxID=238106 RepID=UPI003F4FD760
MNRAFSRKKDKSWMHTPETLSKNHIAYNAKFLGSTEVEQPKGTEVVRDAVRKLKFARHIKKSEGQKTPRVELQISIYGVKILEPKTKEVLHNCQLHRISFCADDKTDKRIFTFICIDSESNKHLCYVFDSEKCIQELETENTELKYKVQDLENQLRISDLPSSPLLHIRSGHEQGVVERSTTFIWCHHEASVPCLDICSITFTPMNSPDSRLSTGLHLTPPPSKKSQPKLNNEYSIPRPRAGSVTPKSPSTDIFDMVPFTPLSFESTTPTRNGTQCISMPSRSTEIKKDLFGAEPFDPFCCAVSDYTPDIQSKLDEMQEGFKMGLTVEGTVFCLDPVENKI